MGGAELLFIRCAIFLSNNNYTIYYIDYQNGFSRQYIDTVNKIRFIEYNDRTLLELPTNALIIMQLDTIMYFDRILSNPGSYKYLFWGINPMNLVGQIEIINGKLFSISTLKRNEIGRGITKLMRFGVIKFMDYNNLYTNSNVFNISISDKCFLPVTIDNFEKPKVYKSTISDNCITFLWLGRLDKDKYNTIVTFMNELESFSKEHKVRLFIVGSGSMQDKLIRQSKGKSYEIGFLGRLRGAELDDIIDNKIDIGIGMGLSSLEIAKRGKPVILQGFLEKVYTSHTRFDYICLNEAKDYDVVSPGYYIKDHIYYFDELANNIIENYAFYSEACAGYVYEKFTLKSVGPLLSNSVDELFVNWNNSIYEEICLVKDYFKESKLKKNMRRILHKAFLLCNQ